MRGSMAKICKHIKGLTIWAYDFIHSGTHLVKPTKQNYWPQAYLQYTCLMQLSLLLSFYSSFYRAMLCIRGTSHGPVSVCPSVCPSVTSRCSTKTANRRITQTTPHDSPGTLVFWCQRSPRNSTGVTPYEGAECRWGGSKSATFH